MDTNYCSTCQGSGEGQHEGFHCEKCNGSGVMPTSENKAAIELQEALLKDYNELMGVSNEI